MFGNNSREELDRENREVHDLIEEQKQKESIEVYRRAWCINQATCMDDCSPSNVIDLAEKIYRYVYGDKSGA